MVVFTRSKSNKMNSSAASGELSSDVFGTDSNSTQKAAEMAMHLSTLSDFFAHAQNVPAQVVESFNALQSILNDSHALCEEFQRRRSISIFAAKKIGERESSRENNYISGAAKRPKHSGLQGAVSYKKLK
ncbi:unnamed protein product [Cylicocyclus nassatus]|uniref:Uncharacterized protein n=1 Tax=Cylicocyclus nassatus TaxID=53992 RepID=A0AA36M932_CYLNA|nr:unnamed protein product [Cylicocyclus nassatus]